MARPIQERVESTRGMSGLRRARDNTAAYIHRMAPMAVQTAATASARTVRVQVITPPAALSR